MSLDIYNKAGASDGVPVFWIFCFRIGKMFCAEALVYLWTLYSVFLYW